MVLIRKHALLACCLLLAASEALAQGRRGFQNRPQSAADTSKRLMEGGLALSGFSGRSGGPRPLLFGFALECTRCAPMGRRGGFDVGFSGTGVGPLAVWHYDEFPRVAAVAEGGPAELAGIREGDLLLDVDGMSLLTQDGAERFSGLRNGDTVTLKLERSGKPFSATLTLGRQRAFGRKGAPPMGPKAARFTTRVGSTMVDVVSDVPVLSSTDSSGTTLRIGSTTIHLRPSANKAP